MTAEAAAELVLIELAAVGRFTFTLWLDRLIKYIINNNVSSPASGYNVRDDDG